MTGKELMTYTKIIAEAGVNHNGEMALAYRLIDAAVEAEVDVVKFQTYIADEVMTDQTPLADYMGDEEANFLDLARKLELSLSETLELKAYAEAKGIGFLSSPFDEPSVYALQEIGLKELKIPSGETVNPFVMKAAAKSKLPLIVSTGMCDLEDLRWAISFLKEHDSGPVTLLHCTTQYPAVPENLNLKAMQTLATEFNLPVGYSDHSTGIEIPIAAVAMGASVIEKHFTLDKTLAGPDHAASLEPAELKAMVQAIRKVNVSLGTGIKKPFPIEVEVAAVARKSLVLKADAKAGAVIDESTVTAKRPGTGIPAMDFAKFKGRRLKRDLAKNHILTAEDFTE